MANLSKIKLPNGDEYNFRDAVTSSFSNVKVGSTTIEADTPTDTLELVAGTNVTLTSDATNDSVTINSKDEALQEQVDEITPTIELKEDQEFLYRQVPVNYDGTGTITDIKGNTVKFNQLVQNGNFADTSNWGSANATLTTNNNVGTVQSSDGEFNIYHNISLPVGVYLIKYDIYLHDLNWANSSFNYTNFTNTTINDSWVSVKNKIILTTDATLLIFTGNRTSSSGYFMIKNVMLLNLSLMGLENLTSTEVEDWLSDNVGLLPYYDYTPGTLIPFSGTGLKITGKNLLNMNTAQRAYIQPSDFAFISSGDSWTFTVNVIKNTTYVITANNSNRCRIGLTNNPNFQTGQFFEQVPFATNNPVYPITFNSEDYSYAYIQLVGGNQDLPLPSNPQVQIGSTPSYYEPYTESTLTLPISTYFSTGMKSAGSVYDELSSSKAITRVGMVNLDNFTWDYNTDYQMWISTTGISDSAPPRYLINANIPSQLISLEDAPRQGSFINSAYNIWFRNGSDTVKPSGVAYYILATPTSQDVSLDLTYPIYNNGTEQILPVNTNVPVTAPIIADIEYHNIAQKVIDVVDTIGGTTTINSIDNVGTLPTLTFTPDSTTGNLTISWSQGTLPVKGSDTSVIKSK